MAGSQVEARHRRSIYSEHGPQYSAVAALVSRTVPALRMVTFFIDFTPIPYA